MDELFGCINLAEPFTSAEEADRARLPQDEFDDFAAAPVAVGGEELRRPLRRALLLRLRGRRPDDRVGLRPHGNHRRRLNPIFSSDVGHFDVVDMTEVLEEAWELVEHGLITEDDFREFVFANPARCTRR